MTCADVRTLLHVYADGELDPVRSLGVAEHLGNCPCCGQAFGALQALRGVLAQEPLRHTAPAALHREIRSSLRATERAEAPRRLPWWLLAVAASVALVALLGWWAFQTGPRSSGEDRLAHDVLTNHIRSLMLDLHLVDMKSSDRHILKPWFQGKLNFAPTVVDLADRGFPLVGARLDYLDDRRVAAIVYRRRDHLINLFLWPSASGADQAPQALERQGYHLLHWSAGGMTGWAVSDLNSVELEEFARLVLQR
jgi:anti-sigma factor RsiW